MTMTSDEPELTAMPPWYGHLDDSGWRWHAARWPVPFSQHELDPAPAGGWSAEISQVGT